MRVAAIDCGTNSIRLLLLSGSREAPVELVREVRLARLGQGVDATGEFHPDALARTFAVCEEYARIIRDHGAEKVRFVATSAARDVSNRRLLVDGRIETKCVSLCDVTIHRYGFIGATQNEAQNQRDLCLVLCRLEGVFGWYY